MRTGERYTNGNFTEMLNHSGLSVDYPHLFRCGVKMPVRIDFTKNKRGIYDVVRLPNGELVYAYPGGKSYCESRGVFDED